MIKKSLIVTALILSLTAGWLKYMDSAMEEWIKSRKPELPPFETYMLACNILNDLGCDFVPAYNKPGPDGRMRKDIKEMFANGNVIYISAPTERRVTYDKEIDLCCYTSDNSAN